MNMRWFFHFEVYKTRHNMNDDIINLKTTTTSKKLIILHKKNIYFLVDKKQRNNLVDKFTLN